MTQETTGMRIGAWELTPAETEILQRALSEAARYVLTRRYELDDQTGPALVNALAEVTVIDVVDRYVHEVFQAWRNDVEQYGIPPRPDWWAEVEELARMDDDGLVQIFRRRAHDAHA
jgi:hypothetical protein